MNKTTKAHSIHCAGYRGSGQPWDEEACNCGAMPREVDMMKLLDQAQAAQHRLEIDISNRDVMIAYLQSKMQQRKCHACGHVGWYTDNTIPHCLCDRCKSADTRLVRIP